MTLRAAVLIKVMFYDGVNHDMMLVADQFPIENL